MLFFCSEIVELLLKAGSDVNDQSGEHCYGVSPLHDAAENGHLDVVKVLLKYGASLNLTDSRVSQRSQLKHCDAINDYGTVMHSITFLSGCTFLIPIQ